ncbi:MULTISPECIES: hypothetical protein [unclassified Pseudomonas]|uniref:hypothetical protein n=1 Tax=unclassified Pseudomonas TaxID=196821 RepID=UPI0021BB37A1|nr:MULTISPECIES: hypothetical protein [unclassified Pseudomonas]MCT8164966.1 hypothetical protein [Pseudomonas sp. HD6422]MCT8183864.1 hypothetical protein [Pseudomonas sp. HD6421]
MVVGIRVIGTNDCRLSGCNIEGFDVGVDATDSTGLQFENNRIVAATALKGARVNDLAAKNIQHYFIPKLSYLSSAIRRAINGYV